MFTIAESPEFTHDVPVLVPVDDGQEERKLRTRFRAIPAAEADSFDLGSEEGRDAFLDRVVVGFHDLVDDAGRPVACTDEIRGRLMGYPFVRTALTVGYLRAVSGARLGN
ncbi:MAG: hypothetical protein ACK4QW_18495 [Alphaproteobacteria bacterium]